MHVAPFKAARHAARVRLVWRFVRSQAGQAVTPLAAFACVLMFIGGANSSLKGKNS